MKGFLLTSALALATTGLATAAPITIDDFSANQFVDDVSPGTVDDAGILGGERDVVANSAGTSFNAAGGSATAGATGGSHFVLLSYDGDDDNPGNVFYGLGNADLTGGGMNDRFLLDVTAVTGTVELNSFAFEDASNFSQGFHSITTAGLFEIPFASLATGGSGADFAGLERLAFRFDFDINESITLNSISTGASRMQPVPEPSSAALFGLGLCALAAWRKKRQTS